MEKEKLPIQFFSPRKTDKLRIEPGGSSQAPKWVLTGEALHRKAQFLTESLDKIQVLLDHHIRKNSSIPFVFLANTKDGIIAKSKRKMISSLFQVKSADCIIGLSTASNLMIRMDSADELRDVSTRIKDYEVHNYAISCLEDFVLFHPEVLLSDASYNYKIKLINYQNSTQNLAASQLLEFTLQQIDIAFQKINYSEEHCLYKIKNTTKANLDALKKHDIYEAIFSIEPMPKYYLSLDSLDQDDPVRILHPDNETEYTPIGILDNGIAPIPHLKEWLKPERWSIYPNASINPTHGTFVAGIALYGDECENQNWIGHHGIQLFDAAVFPDQLKEGIEEDELIENIKDVIRLCHSKIKIWNLSISVTRPVVDNKFSDFAIALDAIQNNYKVLICKSAGNCNNFVKNIPKGRIHEGADSIRSLVVGSAAHEKSSDDYAEKGDSSPFSRIGPAPDFIIKPEISHYGGNAGVDANGKMVTTGVKSFSKDGSMSRSIGTSFSTPRITALAAGLQQELKEEFDPLLIKTLMIHSASYPKETASPLTDRVAQMGFGVPRNVSDILYNSPHEATLILRDQLTKGEKIDIMDFPMPHCLIKDGFYTGQIIATLVYNPILDPSQGIEYCQSKIDIRFGSYSNKLERDTSKRHIFNPIGRQDSQNLLLGGLYSKNKMKHNMDDFALKERLTIQYGERYCPVKKYAVDLAELTDLKKIEFLPENKKWFLYLQGRFRDHIEKTSQIKKFLPIQEFCLILTIRDPNKKESVYDEVTQKLDEYNFWHNNIKLSNDISVSV